MFYFSNILLPLSSSYPALFLPCLSLTLPCSHPAFLLPCLPPTLSLFYLTFLLPCLPPTPPSSFLPLLPPSPPPPINSRINIKGETLKNVALSERLFTPVNSPDAIHAVASYGSGFVGYFSDVNMETSTIELVVEFLQRARRRAVVLPKPIDEFLVPEAPLKVCGLWDGF